MLEHAAEDLTVADIERENHGRPLKRHVVDEPHVAEADRAQPPSLAVFDVVDDESRRAQRSAAASSAVGASRQRPVERGAFARSAGEQAAVPRAEGQAVGLADGRTGDDGGRQEERVGHPANEAQLLPVLLAEVGAIGRGNLQELEDDGQHAVEVPGPVRAFQDLRERRVSVTR